MRGLRSAIRIAIRTLEVNKIRSALTMLGIVIGVAAVIATIAIGTGATQRVEQQIASIGSNVIIVIPGSLTTSGLRLGTGLAVSLTEADARALASQCPSVQYAAPVVRGASQVVFESNNWATSVIGITPEYLEIRNLSVARGVPLYQHDIDSASKQVLLGQTVAINLFGDADPLGKIIRIKKVPFTVVGILAVKGQSPSGQDQDDVLLIPISTAKRRVLGIKSANADAVDGIMLQARTDQLIASAQEEITTLLRQRHHLQQGQDEDFSIRNMQEIFSAQEASSRAMSLMLAAVASISLLVGGIGIMNIMLVSVRERTREIGLRMAVGAKTRDILTQFLVEAASLSIIGGLAGILLGIIASVIIAHFAHWQTVIGLNAVLLAVLCSALVGIGFGYYPARQAAYLDPIEALHFE